MATASEIAAAEPVAKGPEADVMQAEDSEELCCAICFEQNDFVELPCACKVNYCKHCWDRSLAASFVARGRARCPSCRSFLRVEFDADAGGLTFSLGVESAPDDLRACLYSKAQPVQIQVLQRFGCHIAERIVCDGSPSNLSAQAEHDGLDHGGAVRNSEPQPRPACFCGAELERISARERNERMMREADPSFASRPEIVQARALERLSACSLVSCDLCGQGATGTGSCWTCKRGQFTMLHPDAYDICEACFDLYTGIRGAELFRDKSAPGAVGLPRPSSAGGVARHAIVGLDNGGCPESFAALFRQALPAWCSPSNTSSATPSTRRAASSTPSETWSHPAL
mmetsp:Transcript_42884/g.124695  ORF Transcript_42884/g.124695 Transcript_42884/m.124695 type:complete len:342 (-) Transcript_42884:296-1321(-)